MILVPFSEDFVKYQSLDIMYKMAAAHGQRAAINQVGLNQVGRNQVCACQVYDAQVFGTQVFLTPMLFGAQETHICDQQESTAGLSNFP